MNKDSLVELLKNSKKYAPVAPQTITRLVSSTASKYKEKDIEKKTKDLLHQIWGAYYSSRPNFHKLLQKIEETKEDQQVLHETLKQILMIHASTKERIPVLSQFYKDIFQITGVPQSIIDHACGFNPLTLPWMNLPSTTKYTAHDIDTEEVEFVSQALKLISPEMQTTCTVQDLYDSTNEYADIVCILKTLPVLEQQQKGSAKEILAKQNCKHLVVSFPLQSIGGNNKGMQNFYPSHFEPIFHELQFKIIKKLKYSSELVYVLTK